MTDVSTWNAVDDSNNAAAPAGWPEGMMPSGVNNAARAMQGALKRWRDQSQPTVTATGSGNAQIITYPVAPAALASGDVFCFFALANTGPATLQVNAQAAKPVQTSTGTALIGGEMPAGAAVMVVYDGTNFRMLAAPTPLSVSNGGTGQTTPGAAADAIGAVKDTGDTMTGDLTVTAVRYSGNPYPGSSFQFGWDGSATHVYVNGTDVGVIGDISSVVAGNGLTGGGTSGALSLAMSGGYTGNFTASGQIAGGTGSVTGLLNTGSLGVFNNAQVNGNINANGAISAGGQVSGNTVVGNSISSSSGTIHTPSQWAYDNHVYSGTHGYYYNGLVAFSWAAVYAFSYPGASDRRLKTDIQDVPDNCTALVEAISPRRFKWREGATILDHTQTHWGFVAQEVGEKFAAAGLDFGGHHIGDDADKSEALDSTEMVAVLWGAVQELTARLKQLETALIR